MDTINLHDERLQWLRFVLSPDRPLPEIQDWQGLYDFTINQTIAGICSPTQFGQARLTRQVLVRWVLLTEQLKFKNGQFNKQSAMVATKLKEAGFRCCILKGQGNAAMYAQPGLRIPGDIDVWVDADKDKLYAWVKELYPQDKVSFKHIKFSMFKQTEVDVHYTPLKFYHPVHNRRLQQWIEANKEEQMTHYVRLADTDADVAIPTIEFNAVYQMGHILIHLMDEGIGLRHMVDYYYVLKHLRAASASEREKIKKVWNSLGMLRLASAVMWIEHEALGLPKEYLLAEPNERMGRHLLEDILEGGNFGHYRNRLKFRKHGRYVKKSVKAWHLIRLFSCFPGEASFRMLRKIRTFGKIFLKKHK